MKKTTLVVGLIALGVISGVARTFYPSSLGERLEPLRARIWQAVDLQEPFPAARRQEVREFEARFAAEPLRIALHAGVGALFLLIGSIQFLPSVRSRYIQLHRWNGRVLVVAGLMIAATGMYFGMVIPVAGAPEVTVIGIAGALFIVSLLKGVLAIRKKNVRSHREWMIRAFAVAVGISTVRIVAGIADATMTPHGWTLRSIFVLSLALGWGITIGIAELWIVRTRESWQSQVPGDVGTYGMLHK